VGDPDQCLRPGTLIDTPSGKRPIESLRDGDRVLSANGWGDCAAMWIDKVMVNPFKGRLVKISVEGGTVVRATPNHKCFTQRGMHIELTQGEFDHHVRLSESTDYPCIPARHIHPGMLVPVLVDDRVVDRRVEAVEWEDYEGPVYDLSVPETHNFSADGLIVHNSIYKFRGSDIRNILDFERDFPSARVLTLSMNYRSTKSILAAAGGLIVHNTQRKPKDLVTENPHGQKVAVLTFETGVGEAEGIARIIKQQVESGKRSYRDFAILIRINALTRGLETAFVQQRIPFQIVRGLAFFDRKENRDVLAYLRLLLNPRDNVSFERVVNEPARGIGKVTLEHLKTYAQENEMSLLGASARADSIKAIKGKAATGLRDFAKLMQELSEYSKAQPDEVIRQVLDRSGYRKMLKESRDEEDQDRLANIEELITAAKQFADEDNSRTIGDFLENITLASDVDSWDQQQDCVAVMTMHAAKGLEFPVVFLASVEQGLLPHERSLNKNEEIEEERRLAFVGMTRAKEELYLCHARMREFRGQTLYAVPSMFLNEVPPHSVEMIDLSLTSGRKALETFRGGGGPAAREGWEDAGVEVPLPIPPKSRDDDPYTVGMQVRHASYGVGHVIGLSGFGATRTVKIRFRTAGEHSFRVKHVKLEVLGRG
jgi:DNA helicase-2/ATP-dependent DNA helicase PcrA